MQKTKIACSPQFNPHPTIGERVCFYCISSQVECDLLVGEGEECAYQLLQSHGFLECTNYEARMLALDMVRKTMRSDGRIHEDMP